MLHPIFKAQSRSLQKIFKENNVKTAYAFGSVVGDRFNEFSDIDLLINFDDDINALDKGDKWWILYDALRDLFQREVDIIIEGSLKNPYFIEEINEKKQLIYAA